MKKRMLIILLVFICALCINLRSNASYSNDLPISNSTSYNLLNPEYITISGNVISYEGRIQYKANKKYYLGINGIETNNDASVTIDTSEQGSQSLKRVKAIKFIFLLDFSSSGPFTQTSNSSTLYFTFSNLTCSYLQNVSLDTLKNSMYVKSTSEGSYYSPYVDDTNTLVDKSKAIVTSTDNKLDLNQIGQSFNVNGRSSTITLTSDGGYNVNYQTPGVYIATYNISTPGRTLSKSVSIYVFEKASCQLSGPTSLSFETASNIEGYYTFQQYVEAKFTATYGDRQVTLGYKILDSSGKTMKFEDVIQKAGIYSLYIMAYYNNEVVAENDIELEIEDDEEIIEVYFPYVILDLTTVKTYTEPQLCAELEKTLQFKGLSVSNVCILKSEYNESAEKGEYNVVYSYDVDGTTYINQATIKVEDEQTSADVIDNNTKEKGLSGGSIALISISSVLLVLVLVYTFIRIKHKH